MYSYILCPHQPDMTNRHLQENQNQFLDMPLEGPLAGLPTQPMLMKSMEQPQNMLPPSQNSLQASMPLSFPSMSPVEEQSIPPASYDFSPAYPGISNITPQSEFAVPPTQPFPPPTLFSAGFMPQQHDRYQRVHELECCEESQDLRLLMYGLAPAEGAAHLNIEVGVAHEPFHVHPQMPPPGIARVSAPPSYPAVLPLPLAPETQPNELANALKRVKEEERSPILRNSTIEVIDEGKVFKRRSRRRRESSKSSRSSRSTVVSMDLVDSASSATSMDANSPPFSLPPHRNFISPDHCRIVRGAAAGGASVKPPEPALKDTEYLQVNLVLGGKSLEEICSVPWSKSEIKDRRRIVRIERRQRGPTIFADFSIVGSANEHPETEPAPDDADVIEFSCLAWDRTSEEDEPGTNYYITSVEVVAIVETLIQSALMEPKLRRRERGRIRLNLLNFWQKPSFHLKNTGCSDSRKAAFARLIMAYEIRKPRRFDKGFRILKFDRLGPALQKALYCYYAEMSRAQKIRFTTGDQSI